MATRSSPAPSLSDPVERELAHARGLYERGRDDDARDAYLQLLARVPDDVRVLGDFGTLLVRTKYLSAARTVYERAVALAPDDAPARANLGNALFALGDFEGARASYAAALERKADFAPAHQGLSYALTQLGRADEALEHRRLGFAGRGIVTAPYRGTTPPVDVLLLVSAAGGTTYTDEILDDRIFRTTTLTAGFAGDAAALPRHDVILNAISDADRAGAELIEMAARFDGSVPLLNRPADVLRTTRVENARRLSALPGIVAPRVVPLSRRRLVAHGLPYPFLLRAPGYHTGQHFVRVDDPASFAAALEAMPGNDALAIEYIDLRDAAGRVRKYRMMAVDGVLYPLHLAVSGEWKVHYMTSDMSVHERYRNEEARYLSDPAALLGAGALAALRRIVETLALDFMGIDFGLDARGNIVLFEANATMIVLPPGPEPMWDYRRPHVQRIIDAARAMIRLRAERPES